LAIVLVDPQPTGQGTLKELSLHQFETESVALVHWPKGEQFHIHEHMGDEETFSFVVISLMSMGVISQPSGYAARA